MLNPRYLHPPVWESSSAWRPERSETRMQTPRKMDRSHRDDMFIALTLAGMHDDGASDQLTDTWTINIGSNTDEAMVIARHY